MALRKDLDSMFNDDKFVRNYKTGEKVTGQFAQSLIEQSGLVMDANANPEKPLVVFDCACGTGVISSLLHQQLNEKVKENWQLTCGDISEAMLKHTRGRLQSEDWQNTEVKVVDAQETGLPSAHYTHVITAFAYMGLPKSLDALDDCSRILQPGGTIAFSTWIEPGWVPVVHKALGTMPGNLPFPTSQEFLSILSHGEWHSVPWIKSQLQQRGFENIIVEANTKAISLLIPEFVEMAMMMFPIIAKSFWTHKQREDSEDKVRPALVKYLEDRYGKDGDVPVEWTAILITARKPN